MFLLSKILPLFVLPLGLSLMLLLWGVIRRRRGFLIAGIVVLWIGSNPFAGYYLIRSAEGWGGRRVVAEVPNADAVVVLSAGRSVSPGASKASEWRDANRFFGGIELIEADRAPVVIFTGGWTPLEPDARLEGDLLSGHAIQLGVPASSILTTGRVTNTAEEATEVAKLLSRHGRGNRVILVTSAFHMRRAREVFEANGLSVEPFPVSFWFSDEAALSPLSLFPSVGALVQTQTGLREFYGRIYYWLRGMS